MEAYLVTHRRLSADDYLIRLVGRAAAAGVDRIQVREKDLDGRALLRLTREVQAAAAGSRATVLVNDRLDVALCASAAGVHLPVRGLPPDVARRIAGDDLLIGASTHSLGEALAAEDRGADYLFVGPVFPPSSKAEPVAPLGRSGLESMLRRIRVPVYAIGGITLDRLDSLRGLPLTGVAMISEFVRTPSVEGLIRRVHAI